MARLGSLWLWHAFSVMLVGSTGIARGATSEDRKVCIVYMGSLPAGEYSPLSHHLSVLQESIRDSLANNVLVRSYKRSFNGFAANLTDEEQNRISRMDGVVSVFPSKTLQLQTTRSWDFMGFPETVKRQPTIESDMIIGVLDNGIWPESDMFDDKGFGPPPKQWKGGACKGGQNFTCNNKIIGARYYSHDNTTREYKLGHGTHMASIAAGKPVAGASFDGLAKGNVRGAVPSARIAAYRVCDYPWGCIEADILAAFDDAIADGVDIILTGATYGFAFDFAEDAVAIGAFHAMEKGILTAVPTGNMGPNPASTVVVAPWILTVAGSSIDRLFIDKAILGDGTTLVGDAVNPFTMDGNKFPLSYGKTNRSYPCSELASRQCSLFCLDENLVKGKVLVCDDFGGEVEGFRVGALGSIQPAYTSVMSHPAPFPTVTLKKKDFQRVKLYINSTGNPQVNILRSIAIKDEAAPVVHPFSGRGPSKITPDIIKPDLSAPGVQILAAYTGGWGPSNHPYDHRFVKYNILSGTSIASAFAAGAAAYVKSFHPDWSPSSIKSALMTTAFPMNGTVNRGREFDYGSGHIDPVKATNPGLVYEVLEDDYIKMLCGMGYSVNKIRLISGDNSSCPEGTTITTKDLNLPSMAAQVEVRKPFSIKFHRTVTNVGQANSTYKTEVKTTSTDVKIDVAPDALSFESMNDKKSFVVTVDGAILQANHTVTASLLWSDGTHNVRSPIVVYTNQGFDF